MKQKLKRFMAGFMAMLTLVGTLFTNGTTAFAASPQANIAFWNASVKNSGEVSELKPGYNHGKILYSILDGNSAYCMNFGLRADGGQLMNSYDDASTSMSAQQRKLLSYCLYYGFNSTQKAAPSNSQCDEYIATQAMVWVIVADIFGTGSGDSAARKLCNTAPSPDSSYSYYERLRDNISSSYNATLPSFASRRTSEAPTYELKWNEGSQRFETTLSDSNGVLSDFDFGISGYSVDKNGNSITISSTSVNTTATTGTFTSNAGKVETTSSCVFWLTGKSGYQEFISERPTADPIKAYIKVKTENIGYGELTKTDESSGVKLSGAVYGIYSDSGCTNRVQTMTTDGNGYAKSAALVAGTYYVKEITAPKGYVLSGKVHTLTVKAGQTTGISATDKEQLGAITIYKEGEVLSSWNGSNFTYEKKKLSGATFKVTAGADIYKADGTKVYSAGDVVAESLTTGTDGQVVLSDLHLGTYVVTEIKSIDGYTINTTPQTVAVEYKDQTVTVQYESIITVEYSDAPAVGELTVEKKGEVLDGFKGGLLASSYEKEFVYKEGSLAGAKFKVYAAEDIYTADNQKDADGNRIKYYSKGDLVTTLTTGKDGKATVKNLPLGQYRVVEVEAPYGYVLNPNEQKVTFTYVDDKTPVIKESLTFSDDRQKLDMSVTKLDAEDNTPIAGAVFGLYADEDIKNADGRVIIEKGTLLEKATSDENGKIAFVKDYPFAKYVARELVKPAGYVTNEEAVNFDTKYQGQDVKTAVYNSKYKNTPTTFEFTKTDITSGAELTGATLTVLDKDGNVVDTWTSDAKEAHVIKRLVVGETYTLREEFAPYGYLKATDIQFTVEDTGKVQHVEMKDEVPTGSIVINKDGEFVTDTTLMKGYWYDFIFNFFKDSLAGVTFDVYAKEDIVSADGLDTVYHKAGDKVATIVTNDKGIARIDDLPLGKYYLVETKTIDGFVLDDTPIEADLSYIDQNTKVVFAGMDVTNERQKVQITVTKTDSETKKELEGAVFGLYAKEDIVNKDGKVIVKADTQIERGVTGKDGKVTFTSDLPLGQYYVKEIEAPKGYVKSDKIFDVDASYQGDKVKVIEFKAAFENAPIKVEISKTDITGEKELPGAKLSVIDADGKLVESWTSEAGKTHMIERLPVGKYTLREESAPYGYKVASDVTFEVKETAEIQKVSMKDEQAVGKIVIEKTDKVTGKPIEGVVFEVRDKDGKVLDTLTTDKNGHAESKELPICTYNEDGTFKEDIHYTVVETKAADGYILDETAHDVTLRYDDNAPDVVVATLKLVNVPTEPKLPQTGDNANPLLYLGIGALALITGVGVGLRGRKKKNKQ